jgi:DNA-binding XRE family transcriptional regulator
MAIPAENVFQKTMTPEARLAAKTRGADLIDHYLTMQQLRKTRDFTQVQLGHLLGKDQAAISQLEKRHDMLLSTLTRYVEAMGGTLKIMIEFPDSQPVFLTGIAENEGQPISK